jgi:hypothetical protein
MMTHNDSRVELKKYPPTALFLETSAQILRLQGPALIQKEIRALIDDTRKNSGRIATSAHVKRECHNVVNGFFDSVQARIALLTDPETERPIEQLWREIRDIQMPMFFSGGRSLLDDLGDYITDLYKGRWVRPKYLDSVVATYRDRVISGFKAFKIDQVFDRSTCEVWESSGHSCSLCDIQFSPKCRLKDTCVADRTNFLASAKTLAEAGLAESKWLKKNLETLKALEGKGLHEFLGKHPGHVGDAIIFWEVPDGWTILSRDRAFRILRDEHRKEVGFFMVRIPREKSGKPCVLRPADAAEDVEGTLDNYNSQGARVYAPGMTVRARQRMSIQAKELSSRDGEVTRFHEPSSVEEAQRNAMRPTFGLKFKAHKGKR